MALTVSRSQGEVVSCLDELRQIGHMLHFNSQPAAEMEVKPEQSLLQPQLCVLRFQGWTCGSCRVSRAHVSAVLFAAWPWPSLKPGHLLGGQQA